MAVVQRTIAATTMALWFAGVGCNAAKPEQPNPAQAESRTGAAASAGTAAAAVQAMRSGAFESKLTDAQRAEVVAKYTGREITLGELEQRLADLPANVRLRYNTLERLEEFVEEIVRLDVMAAEAKRLGYDQHPTVVRAIKQAMVKELIDNPPKELTQLGEITDEDISSYYNEHKSDFVQPARRKVSVIALPDRATADRVAATLAEVKAREPDRLDAAFAKAVATLSNHEATKATHGSLGLLTRDGKNAEGAKSEVPDAVIDAAWDAAEVGAVTPAIESEGRYWMALVTDERPNFERTLDEARTLIRSRLLAERSRTARETYIQSLRERAQVEVKTELLSALPAPEFAGPKIEAPTRGGAGATDGE